MSASQQIVGKKTNLKKTEAKSYKIFKLTQTIDKLSVL